MCGIVGFAGFNDLSLLKKMNEIIYSRGPDGEGIIELSESMISLAMRRLAIIDIDGGQQPFISSDKKVYLVFNGEIYNHEIVREELLKVGYLFETRSDTEVVLNAYLHWGNEAWQHLQGMFAIAIADLRDKPFLLLVKDRVGIKPLYYLQSANKLLFASELKALTINDNFSPSVNMAALRDYLALRYVPGPRCLLNNIAKLPAGHVLKFSNGITEITKWWSPPDVNIVNSKLTEIEACDLFDDAMRLSVKRHMISDVPVGAFLSGGVDSNVIVAMMGEFSSQPVHTFSIGFPEFSTEELNRAQLAADILGTKHTPIECTANDMQSLSNIAWSLDEPVGDAIVVPMYVLAREARKDVKVVLSGEGADEILGGYFFHRKLVQIEHYRKLLPLWSWSFASHFVKRVPVNFLNKLFDYPGTLGYEGRARIAQLLGELGKIDLLTLYRNSISLCSADEIQKMAYSQELMAMAKYPVAGHCKTDFNKGAALQKLIQFQFHDWLPDDILNKLDKMTMAHSLEGRVPFMDEAVILAAMQIPDKYKLTSKVNKKVLREVAARYLPKEISHAPKAAFYLPLESYIKTPIVADLFQRTLDKKRIQQRGLFNYQWVDHLRKSDASAGFLPLKKLFSIVMLELWFERFCPDVSWA